MTMIDWLLACCLRGAILYNVLITADYCDRVVLWTWQRMMAQSNYYTGQADEVWFSRN